MGVVLGTIAPHDLLRYVQGMYQFFLVMAIAGDAKWWTPCVPKASGRAPHIA